MSTVPAFWARNFDDFDTARKRFEDILRAFREQGDEATARGVLTHLARIEAMTGQMDRARRWWRRRSTSPSRPSRRPTCTWRCARRASLVRPGRRADRGQGGVRGDAATGSATHPDVMLEGMARAVLGMVALSAGDLAEADRQLIRGRRDRGVRCTTGSPRPTGSTADHAEAVIGLGDLARAEELVQRMEQRASALPRPWISAVSARSRGLLNAATGRPRPGPGRLPARADGARDAWTCPSSWGGRCSLRAACTGAATSGSAPRSA